MSWLGAILRAFCSVFLICAGLTLPCIAGLNLVHATPYRQAPIAPGNLSERRNLEALVKDINAIHWAGEGLSLASEPRRIMITIENFVPGIGYYVTKENIYFRFQQNTLRELSNEDRLVSYVIYTVLLELLAIHYETLGKTPSESELGKLDLATMTLMLEYGYDPREFQNWFNHISVDGGLEKFRTVLLSHAPKNSEGKPIAGADFLPPQVRATQMNLWLQAKEARIKLPNPRPLPRDLELLAFPERIPVFSRVELLDFLQNDARFMAQSPQKILKLISDLMSLPAGGSHSWKAFEEFTGDAVSVNTSATKDFAAKIHAFVSKWGVQNSGNAQAAKAVFEYWTQRLEKGAAPDLVLAALDAMNHRPILKNYVDYKKLFEKGAQFHDLQRVRSLIDLAQAHPDPEVLDLIDTELYVIVQLNVRSLKSAQEKWTGWLLRRRFNKIHEDFLKKERAERASLARIAEEKAAAEAKAERLARVAAQAQVAKAADQGAVPGNDKTAIVIASGSSPSAISRAGALLGRVLRASVNGVKAIPSSSVDFYRWANGVEIHLPKLPDWHGPQIDLSKLMPKKAVAQSKLINLSEAELMEHFRKEFSSSQPLERIGRWLNVWQVYTGPAGSGKNWQTGSSALLEKVMEEVRREVFEFQSIAEKSEIERKEFIDAVLVKLSALEEELDGKLLPSGAEKKIIHLAAASLRYREVPASASLAALELGGLTREEIIEVMRETLWERRQVTLTNTSSVKQISDEDLHGIFKLFDHLRKKGWDVPNAIASRFNALVPRIVSFFLTTATDDYEAFLLGGWWSKIPAKLGFKARRQILRDATSLSAQQRLAIANNYIWERWSKLGVSMEILLLQLARELNSKEPSNEAAALARLDSGITSPIELYIQIASPHADRVLLAKHLSEESARKLFFDEFVQFANSTERSSIKDRALLLLNQYATKITDFSGISLRDIDHAQRTLRYRALPVSSALLQRSFDGLTLEEKQRSLYHLLAKSWTPQDYATLLPLLHRLGAEMKAAKQEYTPQFKQLYEERLDGIYAAAQQVGDVGIIQGTAWPYGLPMPSWGRPGPKVIKLFSKLARSPGVTAYGRFKYYSRFQWPSAYFNFRWQDFFEALLESPQYQSLTPKAQLDLMGLLSSQKGWGESFKFLRDNAFGSNRESPDLYAAAAKSPGIEFKNYFLFNDPKEIEKLRSYFLGKVLQHRRLRQGIKDDAEELRAAQLIQSLEGDVTKALQLLTVIGRRDLPANVADLRADIASHPKNPLIGIEMNRALILSLTNATAPIEFMELLPLLRQHSTPSFRLKQLLSEKMRDFFNAAIALSRFEFLLFRAEDWPAWFKDVFDASRLSVMIFTLHDPRLPPLDAVMLLMAINEIQKGFAAIDTNRSLVRKLIKSPKQFFKLLHHPPLREILSKSATQEAKDAMLSNFYRRLLSPDMPMTLDFALELLGEDVLWPRSDGKGMSSFIRNSSGVALRDQLSVEIETLQKKIKIYEDRHASLAKENDSQTPEPRPSAYWGEMGRSEYSDDTDSPYDSEDPRTLVRQPLLLDKLQEYRHRGDPRYWTYLTANENAKKLLELQNQRDAITSEMESMRKLATSATAAAASFKGPAYEYKLDHSETLQVWLVDQLKKSGNYPVKPKAEFKFLVELAKRGATTFTDAALHGVLMREDFNDARALQQALEESLIWDFDYRGEVFSRFQKISKPYAQEMARLRSLPEVERIAGISDAVKMIHRYFSEETLARAHALESLSALIQSSPTEASRIESAKYDSRSELENSAFKLFRSLDEKLKTAEQKLSFIRFLQGKGAIPDVIADAVKHSIGEPRLLRQFQTFSPEIRAAILDPLITPPHGLITQVEAREALIKMVVEDADAHETDARLLIQALMHALDRTSPNRKSLMLAFLLGQVGRVGGSPGQKLRVLLDSMGGTGQSLGQILYQRRALPDEYLEHLKDLQFNARRPQRFELFEQIAEVLQIERVEDVLDFESIEGAGSARVVLKVKIKDEVTLSRLRGLGFGLAATQEGTFAMKLLRRGLKHSTEREIEMMDHLLEYLETHGDAKYKRLRGPIEAVQRSLRAQADLSLEPKAYAKMLEIYRDASGAIARAGFAMQVVRPDGDASPESEYAIEEFAGGQGLNSIAQKQPEQMRRVSAVLYEKEKEILFAGPDAEGLIFFEDDRHMGNFKVDFSVQPQRIYIFDYPLIAKISQVRRSSMFKMLGYLDYLRETGLRIVPSVVSENILKELLVLIGEQPELTEAKRRILKRAVTKSLEAQSNVRDLSTPQLLLDVLATTEALQVPIDESVYSYLKALGYLERYAPSREDFQAELKERIAPLLSSFAASLSLADQCALLLSRVMGGESKL